MLISQCPAQSTWSLSLSLYIYIYIQTWQSLQPKLIIQFIYGQEGCWGHHTTHTHTHIQGCTKNSVCHFYCLKQRTLKRQERVSLGPSNDNRTQDLVIKSPGWSVHQLNPEGPGRIRNHISNEAAVWKNNAWKGTWWLIHKLLATPASRYWFSLRNFRKKLNTFSIGCKVRDIWGEDISHLSKNIS